MPKAKEEAEHVYSWQEAEDLGEQRPDIDDLLADDQLHDLRAPASLP